MKNKEEKRKEISEEVLVPNLINEQKQEDIYLKNIYREKEQDESITPKTIETSYKYCPYLDNICKESLAPNEICIPKCRKEFEKMLKDFRKQKELSGTPLINKEYCEGVRKTNENILKVQDKPILEEKNCKTCKYEDQGWEDPPCYGCYNRNRDERWEPKEPLADEKKINEKDLQKIFKNISACGDMYLGLLKSVNEIKEEHDNQIIQLKFDQNVLTVSTQELLKQYKNQELQIANLKKETINLLTEIIGDLKGDLNKHTLHEKYLNKLWKKTNKGDNHN